jgi:4-hydroxyphenylacetate 3-monooxygenase
MIAEGKRPSPCLLDGAAYKASLRDGRAVWMAGERVPDVTREPALGAGIDLMAEMFDAQFDPALRDVTTYVDEATGERVSRAWHVPKTVDDLRQRRKLIEFTSMKTVGTFGRPPDLAPLIGIGLLARKPQFKKSPPAFARNNPDFADNIDRYVEFGRRNNRIAAEVLADPQNDRSGPSGATAGLLRIVDQERAGVRVSGAKSVGSLAAQAHEILFTNLLRPDFPPEACVWAALPVATEGLKLVCREPVTRPGADPFDHPIASRCEESDQFLIFDRVLIPNERVFNVGDPELLRLYGPVTVWAHWHILTRLWVKAEIFVGTAQAVVDAIGMGKFPHVRAHVAELIQYAQALKAFVIAAENTAAMTEGDVLAPDVNLLTAGRLYSIREYPRMVHTLQELCGQGLAMRFRRVDFDSPEIGHYLDELLPGHEISARDKNRLMNFVWDLTTDSNAGRTEIFENVNATPAPLLRERLYNEYPRDRLVGLARHLAGLA